MEGADRLERARFPRHAASVKAARTHALNTTIQWGLTERADDVAIVVSELITNAIVHTKPSTVKEVGLTLILSLDRIRVEVMDSGGNFTIPLKSGDSESESGRGLAIIRALACRIGVTSRVLGKVVWAELLLVSKEVAE